MSKSQLFRRIAIVGGLVVMAIIFAAVTADVMRGADARFGGVRLRSANSDIGNLAFLALLGPVAIWAAIKNWR